mmetsp:Transcript_11861/g.20215  ORF Transcript_11861/g.20215 Transcript_11861/m.20215 type:complete len:114 (+) Transcript_11861:424-765(+)
MYILYFNFKNLGINMQIVFLPLLDLLINCYAQLFRNTMQHFVISSEPISRKELENGLVCSHGTTFYLIDVESGTGKKIILDKGVTEVSDRSSTKRTRRTLGQHAVPVRFGISP